MLPVSSLFPLFPPFPQGLKGGGFWILFFFWLALGVLCRVNLVKTLFFSAGWVRGPFPFPFFFLPGTMVPGKILFFIKVVLGD